MSFKYGLIIKNLSTFVKNIFYEELSSYPINYGHSGDNDVFLFIK